MRSLICLLFIAGCRLIASEPLVALEPCVLVPTDWADGDSFLVQLPDGSNVTLRLYGVDCLETQLDNPTDARRLRAQRRYFGISEAGGSTQESIQLAVGFGREATLVTRRMLAAPFTVHTAFADARGDGKHKRIYGFVTTAAGEDLATELTRLGLARAFGVTRETPEGRPGKSYAESLDDVELAAAKRGAGIWARTDWTALEKERDEERREEEELGIGMGGKVQVEPASIDPNTAARDESMKLPGIGEVTANRIIEGRPYKKIEDLDKVAGIGPVTLERMRRYLTIRPR